MAEKLRQNLYNRFKYLNDDELREIIADDSYDKTAKEVASEILSGDRKEYYEQQERMAAAEEARKSNETIKDSARQTNPLYDDLHQIAGDIRFIKNCIIIEGVIAAAIIVLGFIFTSLGK